MIITDLIRDAHSTTLEVIPTKIEGGHRPFHFSPIINADDDSTEIRVSLEPLSKSKPTRIKLEITHVIALDDPGLVIDTPEANVTLQFQSHSAALKYPDTYTLDVEVSPDEPAELVIFNAAQVILEPISITVAEPTSENRRPSDVLEVEVLAPRPDADSMQWDVTRWNRGSWDRARSAAGTLTWAWEAGPRFDEERWNYGRWQGGLDSYQWQTIIGPSTNVTITRGVTGLAHGADVGTLTVEAIGHLDPRALGITVGTPVRAYIWDTFTTLFTGVLSSAQVTPNPPGSTDPYTVHLEFVDATSSLAATTRYGARSTAPDGSEPWTNKVNRVMSSARQIDWEIVDGSSLPTCGTVWETSLANYLDALTASTNGCWIVNRENTLQISSTQPKTEPIAFSDSFAQPGLYYTAIDMQWDTTAIISAVESTTHAARIEDGEWRADDHTIIVENLTAVTAWTGIKESVDLLTLPTGTYQHDATKRLLTEARKTPPVRSVTLRNDAHDYHTSIAVGELDPMQCARINYERETYSTSIKRIEHHITPKTWTTTVSFTE